MISYTKRYVNIVSLLISIIIYIGLTNYDILLKRVDFNLPLFSIMFKRNSVLVELNSNNINQETKENVEKKYSQNLKKTEENEIKETNWSYLEETKDNRITLITCVENEPEYRRCIQGIEKK